MKTRELTGMALDYAVAKAEGATDFFYDTIATYWLKLEGRERALRGGWAQSYQPSTDWAHGGPIIEREKISINQDPDFPSDSWAASCPPESGCNWFGPTPLIAAMRCYVASKLGEEVEVPEVLA